jgi:hypothetical protein
MEKSKKNIIQELAKYEINRKLRYEINPWVFSIVFIIISAMCGIIVHNYNSRMEPANVSLWVITVGAFVFGFRQWRSNQREISLEKFYDRLDIVNRRLDQWPGARKLVSHFWGEDCLGESYEKAMYVYVELDNLEYVLEKYTRGYMDAKDAFRGITTFESRCSSPEFRRLACQQVSKAGYRSSTIRIVNRICLQTNKSD